MTGTHQECTGAAGGGDLTLGDSTVVSSIHIHDLTGTFIALAGCAIDLYGAGPLVINVDTGPYGLVSAQYGLTATVTTGGGSVTIDNVGRVDAGTTHAAIYGETRGGGAVEITNNGNLTGEKGIWVRTSSTAPTVPGSVDIEHRGNITATNIGIKVDAEDTLVTLLSGTISGAQIGIESTKSLVLENYATVTSPVTAISGGTGVETINNRGTVTGNVDLGGGNNTFTNFSAGIVYSDATFDIGVGRPFANRGTISPGGASAVQTTAVTANLTQTSTGRFFVDLIESSGTVTADQLVVTGSANLAGTIVVQASGNLGKSGSVTILSATNGITNDLGPIARMGGYAYSVSVLANELLLTWTQSGGVFERVNESRGATTSNQQTMAQHLDDLTEGGASAGLQSLATSISDMSPEEAQRAVEKLQPEHYAQRVTDTTQSVQAFMSSVMSCPTLEQNPGFIQEGQCYWAKVGGRQYEWNKTDGNVGGEEEAWTTSGGVQVALRDEWRLGFAGAYEHANISTTNGAATETDRAQGAILLKNRWDTVSLAATAFAGYGWSDTTRLIGFGGLATAESDHGMWFAGSHVRLSQLFEQKGGWYAKPMFDINATRIETEAFREHGAGAANLAVDRSGTWVFSASPALEIGAEAQAGGLTFRPYVRAGATFFDDATYNVTASFIAAPDQPFTVSSEFDRSYLDIAAGVDILSADGVDLKFTYDGRFSEHSDLHSGGVKAAIPF